MIATAIDVILALVLIEGLILVLFHRRTGIPPARLLPNLAAGFFLMLAVRLALGMAGDGVIALCLIGALMAHALDLKARWGRG